MTAVDLRCDANPARLFAKLKVSGERPRYVDDGTLIEFACRDCAKEARRDDPEVVRVLHRYNLAGERIETVAERRDADAVGETSERTG